MDNCVQKNKLINMEFFTHQRFDTKSGQITQQYLEYLQNIVTELGPAVTTAMNSIGAHESDHGYLIQDKLWQVTFFVHDEVVYQERFESAVDLHIAMLKMVQPNANQL